MAPVALRPTASSSVATRRIIFSSKTTTIVQPVVVDPVAALWADEPIDYAAGVAEMRKLPIWEEDASVDCSSPFD